jgi:hypothetical protein
LAHFSAACRLCAVLVICCNRRRRRRLLSVLW